jgi:hypothetical protein
VAALTPKETRWRESLVRNLGHPGDVRTYVRTEEPLLVEGVSQVGLVYADTTNSRQYLVNPGPGRVIVAFDAREIGVSGVDGISFHPHPGGRFIVALLPTPGISVLGVTLSDESKCGDAPWYVVDDEAGWSWPRWPS